MKCEVFHYFPVCMIKYRKVYSHTEEVGDFGDSVGYSVYNWARNFSEDQFRPFVRSFCVLFSVLFVSSAFGSKNSDKFCICWSFWVLFYSWIFISGPLYQWILWLKLVLRGLWDITVYRDALMLCKDWFQLIFSNFATNSNKFCNFGYFGAFFCLNFYFWTFISMNSMVKISFERYTGHKCVLGCTYVLQRLVSINFFQFCNK